MNDLRELLSVSRIIAAESLFNSIISNQTSSLLENEEHSDISTSLVDTSECSSSLDGSPFDYIVSSRLASILQDTQAIMTKQKQIISGPKQEKEVISIAKCEKDLVDVMEIWYKPYGWFFLPEEKIPLVK